MLVTPYPALFFQCGITCCAASTLAKAFFFKFVNLATSQFSQPGVYIKSVYLILCSSTIFFSSYMYFNFLLKMLLHVHVVA